MVRPIDQLNMGLLNRQPMRPRGLNDMGSGLLSPMAGVNITPQLTATAQPTALGRVRGALGQSLSNPNILRGIAAGLLTGPTRTPVSFGQSLLGGLQAGQQLQEAEEDRKLKKMLAEAELSKLQRGTMPKLGAPQTYYDQQGNPISVYSKETPFGTLEALEYGTDKPVDLTGLTKDKPDTDSGKITTETPFSVQLTSDFGGYKSGDLVEVQSITEGNIEKLFTVNQEGKQIEIPLNSFTTEFLSKPDVLKAAIPRINKLDEEIAEQQTSLTATDRFLSLAEQAEQKKMSGIQMKFAGLTGRLKNALGIDGVKGLTSEEELVMFLSSTQQQALGSLRLEVLGPGVLTEQDARRLIASLGPDIMDWFASPQKLREELDIIRGKKLTNLNDLTRRRNSWSRGEVPSARQGLFMPQEWKDGGGTITSWNALKDDEKRKVIASLN